MEEEEEAEEEEGEAEEEAEEDAALTRCRKWSASTEVSRLTASMPLLLHQAAAPSQSSSTPSLHPRR